jgi:Ca2+-binding RTX toxin-like protein
MNICQISSHDLLLCLQSGNLEQSPFFQQVMTIAQAGHLVCLSDYAIGPFLQAELPETAQKQLDQLLDLSDVWATSPEVTQQAQALSQAQAIPLADAIDHGIYDQLNPDTILVADGGRSLPNAEAIADFWQDWQSIRDDLPPSGGRQSGKMPNGGGGSPHDNAPRSDKASHASKLSSETNLLASNSVVFSHRNFVSWSMGLYYVNNAGPIGVPTATQAADPATPTGTIAQAPIQPNLIQSHPGKSHPVNIRVLIDTATQTPTIVIMTEPKLPAQKHLAATTAPADRLNPDVPTRLIATASAQGRNPVAPMAANSIQLGTPAADVLGGGAGNDILVGGAGADRLDGGAGVDTASYAAATAGVAVSLAMGQGTAGEALGDRFSNIENLEGSNFADTLVGDRTNNVLLGRGGNDTIIGGWGNDILQGGSGNNLLVGDQIKSPQSLSGGLAMKPQISPTNGTTMDYVAIEFTSAAPGSSTAGTPIALPPAASPTVLTLSDWIFADAGDDVIDAGDGNNFIAAGAGDNQVDSGAGQDLFVLAPGRGVTTILHYQHHDRLGLVGGIAYEDLTLTPLPTATATAPKLKISLNRDGVEDVLAIVVGVEALSAQAFLRVEYQEPVPLDTVPMPGPTPTGSTPTGSTPTGATQVIPDWLSAPTRTGQTLKVPAIGQLAPNLVVLDPTALRRSA